MKYIKPVAFFILGVLLYFGYKRLSDTEFSRLTLYVLSVTLIAVIWYAWETMRLVQETYRQTEFSMAPFVTLSYFENEDKYKLMNLGHGVALSIKIDNIRLVKTSGLKFYYIHQEVGILPPTCECDIVLKKKINEDISDADTAFDLGALFPQSAHRTFNISIRYRDTVSGEHVTKGRLGLGAFKFDKITKTKWNSRL